MKTFKINERVRVKKLDYDKDLYSGLIDIVEKGETGVVQCIDNSDTTYQVLLDNLPDSWWFYGDDLKLLDEKVESTGRTIPSIVTPDGITLIIDGKPQAVASDHINYKKIVKAITQQKYKKVLKLLDLGGNIRDFGKGKLSVTDGVVKYGEKELHGVITDTILKMIEQGFDVSPMVNFLDNLSLNPSYRAVNELYTFLEAGKIPITEDGHFLVYKSVRSDYKDIHSGTFDNSPGAICEMPRNEVNEDSTQTCSAGLHVASYSYAKSFGNSGSRMMLCKVHPRDVVSIPIDYNNTKMRTCRYEVLKDVTKDGDVLQGQVVYGY